jgi:hypothetical protein
VLLELFVQQIKVGGLAGEAVAVLGSDAALP